MADRVYRVPVANDSNIAFKGRVELPEKTADGSSSAYTKCDQQSSVVTSL